MELATGPLTLEQMQTELDAILSLLQRHGVRHVSAMYGFSCQIEEAYQTIPLAFADLPAFISRTQSDGIWQIGSDDFYITAQELDAEFLLCHESDVHVTSENPPVLEFFRSRWLAAGYATWQKFDKGWEPLAL